MAEEPFWPPEKNSSASSTSVRCRCLISVASRSTEEAMTDGPSTIRPSARLDWSLARMAKNDLSSLPVTSSDGRFLGLLTREDAEAAL